MMYELSLLYPAISGLPAAHSWDGVDYETADGLPLLGPHRNFPRHLFALGSARHGAGLAWTAARLLLRQIHGGSLKSDDAFGFHR
jgi:glycine/D-amino acid oxidase-like deaminating enzyme